MSGPLTTEEAVILLAFQDVVLQLTLAELSAVMARLADLVGDCE